MDTAKLQARLAKHGMIAIIWSIDDVLEVRPDLTKRQAFKVLKSCFEYHDGLIEAGWNTIEIHADELFPQKPEAGI